MKTFEDNKLRTLRRVHAIDEIINHKLDRIENMIIVNNLNLCELSLQQFYDMVAEYVKESMYYDYFSDIDDYSDEWREIHEIMTKYIDFVYGDKIENFYWGYCEKNN